MRKQRTLERKLGVTPEVANALIAAKLDTVLRVRASDEDTLSAIDGISKGKAKSILKVQPRRRK